MTLQVLSQPALQGMIQFFKLEEADCKTLEHALTFFTGPEAEASRERLAVASQKLEEVARCFESVGAEEKRIAEREVSLLDQLSASEAQRAELIEAADDARRAYAAADLTTQAQLLALQKRSAEAGKVGFVNPLHSPVVRHLVEVAQYAGAGALAMTAYQQQEALNEACLPNPFTSACASVLSSASFLQPCVTGIAAGYASKQLAQAAKHLLQTQKELDQLKAEQAAAAKKNQEREEAHTADLSRLSQASSATTEELTALSAETEVIKKARVHLEGEVGRVVGDSARTIFHTQLTAIRKLQKLEGALALEELSPLYTGPCQTIIETLILAAASVQLEQAPSRLLTGCEAARSTPLVQEEAAAAAASASQVEEVD